MKTAKILQHFDEQALLASVCRYWCEMLGVSAINADDNFYLAGGDSLQLSRLLMRLQAEWEVELPLAQPWLFSTPRKMAGCCGALMAGKHSLPKPGPGMENTLDFPASCSQQGLWFSELQADNRGLYNNGTVLELQGPLQVAVLEQALNAVRLQFPLLQSCLQPDAGGKHLRVVIPACKARVLHVEELPLHALAKTAQRLMQEPFELGLSLWRWRLFRHSSDSYSLLLCCHHCLLDGWSGTVLLQQLARAYNALLADPHWLPGSIDTAFARHCWRQQLLLCSGSHATRLAWWQARLADLPPSASLPWQAQPQHWPYRLQSRRWLWPQVQLQLLLASCASCEVTLFAALVSALASALAEVGKFPDQVIAFPVAGRTRTDEEASVGCYMNLLPVRITLLEDESIRQLMLRVQQELTQVQAHAVPWQSLVQTLRPPLLADGNAWSEVILALQNFPAPACSFAELACRTRPLASAYGQHVLKLEVTTVAAGLCVQVDYAEAVLSATLVESIATKVLGNLQMLMT